MLPATQVRARDRGPDPVAGELRGRKKQRTRRAIEDAALELFAERGYEETTVDQIATRAEVGRATFFRYFDSKSDVVFGGPDDRHRDLQRAILERPPSEGPLNAVRNAMREQWLPGIDRERTVRQTRAARTSPILRGLSLDLAQRWQHDVSEAVAERQRLDQPDRQCQLVAALAFTAMSNAVNLWMDQGGTDDLAAEIDEAFDLMCVVCVGDGSPSAGGEDMGGNRT
jgi:AcrR family transcriptional regulator